MTLKLGDFSAELLHCIFRFCSRRDLASLSQVNSAFQQAAEYILYRHINVTFDPSDLVPDTGSWAITEKSLFHTLASNPRKAVVLRKLRAQFVYKRIPGKAYKPFIKPANANYSILGRVADALKNADALVDLRIMVDPFLDFSKGKLSETIMSGHFQLHTLYCDASQDLKGIIASQKYLRLLGFYYIRNFCSNLSTFINDFRHIQTDCNREVPAVFMLSAGSVEFLREPFQLTLFPELCLPGEALTLCRDVATSLGRGLDRLYDIDRLAIYVVDYSYSTYAIICEVLEAIAQCFADCTALSVKVQTSVVQGTILYPWRIPGFSASLSGFKLLERLDFYMPRDFSDGDSPHPVGHDLRSFVFEELLLTCPTLREAFVSDLSQRPIRIHSVIIVDETGR